MLMIEARKDILDYPSTVVVKNLRWYLGKMNFYATFIKNMNAKPIPSYEKNR